MASRKTKERGPVSVREAVDAFIRLTSKEKLDIVRGAGVKLVPLKPMDRKTSAGGKPGGRRRSGRAA